MAEFTGERVVPGEVNADLWAEHLARYAFAARFANAKRVLDVGCGTGYGSAELARKAAEVLGIDLSPEATSYAREHYGSPNLHFAAASASALPVRDRTFDLIVAFEVIEHLKNWPELLAAAKRALAPGGLFLVSTPNVRYYAESRGTTGPNPFHEHEFEFAEFRDELTSIFGEVAVLAQNRTECFAFQPWTDAAGAEALVEGTPGAPDEAHFFIALCGTLPPEVRAFVYVPTAANLLRERERHIAKLEGELLKTKGWLEEVRVERTALIELTGRQKAEIEQRNRWAMELDGKLKHTEQRVVQLQDEFQQQQEAGARMAQAYESQIASLAAEHTRFVDWARQQETSLQDQLIGRTADLAKQTAELANCVALLDKAEATVVERTTWAQNLDDQLKRAQALLEMAKSSRWVRVGNSIGLGPKL